MWSVTVLLTSLLIGCGGGGRDEILGNSGDFGPAFTVKAVMPADNAPSVPVNNTRITATFSEKIAPLGGGTSFTVTCVMPCVSPTGTVSLDASEEIVTFALAPGDTLEPLVLYTATLTGFTSLAAGTPLIAPYEWHFTTGATADTTRPRVTVTVPVTSDPGPTTNVPINTAVSATFTEDMDPATIGASSFILSCGAPCVGPVGMVNYAVGSKTAVFTPDAVLAEGETYTATITMAAKDLVGNELAGNQALLPAASDYVWSFTTVAALPPQLVTVQSTTPDDGDINVCPDATVNATFNMPSGLQMDPTTIDATTFLLTGPAPALTPVTADSVVLDSATTGSIATFTPLVDLIDGDTYTATIKSGNAGVKDLVVPANTMLNDYVWSFTVGPATGQCLQPPALGAVEPFGTFGGTAGMTNQGLLTVINGDIGTTAASTSVTGFHDAGPGCTYTETPLNNGTVNGLIYTAPPSPTVACPSEGTAVTEAIALQASLDGRDAYNTLAGLAPTGPLAANLSGLTVPPGVYFSATGFLLQDGLVGSTGDLTLDGQGDGNAVWVFQSASTLTVGGPGAAFPRSVTLINGAKAKNVFWQVGSAATINAAGGGTMQGTIIAQDGIDISTSGNVDIVTLNGRALSLGASVTVVNTVINVPAP